MIRKRKDQKVGVWVNLISTWSIFDLVEQKLLYAWRTIAKPGSVKDL